MCITTKYLYCSRLGYHTTWSACSAAHTSWNFKYEAKNDTHMQVCPVDLQRGKLQVNDVIFIALLTFIDMLE